MQSGVEMLQNITPDEIIAFWFSEPVKKLWYKSTPAFDQQLLEQYQEVWLKAKEGGLDHWRDSATGCLALVIVLDQLPLNMFRGQAKSFSTEKQAIDISHWAIAQGFDQEITPDKLGFLYIPLMHSESISDQILSVKLFTDANLKGNIRFAKHHRDLIEEFGRFPHRNLILGRESTPQEIEYLNSKRAFKG